jgi:hypothetical protein
MKEIIKCDECGEIFDNKKIKANHVRWKHRDQSAYIIKASSILKDSYKKKHGIILKESVECSCETCSNIIEIEYRENKKKKHYFCSRSCSNYRGKRSIETKQKISESLKQKSTLKKCKCEHCLKEFEHNRPKKFCSTNCHTRFKRKDKSGLSNYRVDASFKFNLSDYPGEFDFSLVEKYGWYSAANRGNNLNGVSRDHMVSVKYGYDNNIDPKIISHPANCKLMRHNNNVSKLSNCSITIEELLEKIKAWDEKYETF